MLKKAKIKEIVDYAGDVIDVNLAAKRDMELLMERVDDVYGTDQMHWEDRGAVEEAIADAYFTSEYPDDLYRLTRFAPAPGSGQGE